jgi:hypothetical protein
MTGRASGPAAQRGTSTVEVLVCMLLMALVIHLSWSLLVAARDATERLIQRSQALDTERIGWHVLALEVGAGLARRDWTVEGGGVLPLRAFRGVGEVCPSGMEPDGGLVRHRGVRLPDPVKDSLLLLTRAGEWRDVKLTSRSPSLLECPAWPGEAVERWHWEPAVAGVLLARVFERGSYHLEERAVRYRLGEAGRQPLTEERLERGSSFGLSETALSLRLRVRVDERTVWDTTRRLGSAEASPDE